MRHLVAKYIHILSTLLSGSHPDLFQQRAMRQRQRFPSRDIVQVVHEPGYPAQRALEVCDS